MAQDRILQFYPQIMLPLCLGHLTLLEAWDLEMVLDSSPALRKEIFLQETWHQLLAMPAKYLEMQ